MQLVGILIALLVVSWLIVVQFRDDEGSKITCETVRQVVRERSTEAIDHFLKVPARDRGMVAASLTASALECVDQGTLSASEAEQFSTMVLPE